MLTGLILDGTNENSFRSQATNQQFGMLKYEEILTAELFQLAVIFFFSRVTDVGMNSILTRNKTISQKVVTEFSKFQGVQKLLFSDILFELGKITLVSKSVKNIPKTAKIN